MLQPELEFTHGLVRPGRREVVLDVLDEVGVFVGREALQEGRRRILRQVLGAVLP